MNSEQKALLAIKSKRYEKISKLCSEKSDDCCEQYKYFLDKAEGIALADLLDYSTLMDQQKQSQEEIE